MENVVDVGEFIENQPIGSAQWVVIALCACVAMLDGLNLQSIGLAAPGISAQLHVHPREFGAVFSAALAGLALGAFFLGPLADRVGRKAVLVASTLVFGVFTLFTAYVSGMQELLIIRFVAGAGLGGAMPSFISLASESVAVRRRAAITSLLWAGFPLGGVVGGFLGSWIIPTYGWKSIFLVGGIVSILLAAALLVVLPESLSFLINANKSAMQVKKIVQRMYPHLSIPEGSRFVIRQEAQQKAGIGQLFASGRALGTILLWVSFFFTFMLLVTNSAWTPILLHGAGMAVKDSAIAMALYNFGSLFGSGVAGVLLARYGVARILPLTLAIGAASYAVTGMVPTSIIYVTIANCLCGLLVGCASSGLIALSAVFYPTTIRSTGVGWATAAGRIGSFTGPLLVGVLVGAHWSIQNIFFFVGSTVMISVVACLILGLLKSDRETVGSGATAPELS